MNLNANKGKGLIHVDEPAPKPVTSIQDKIEANAAKMAQLAENSADIRSISTRITKAIPKPYYTRSYRMSETNLLKLEAYKTLVGSDFNFQINKAVEYWFKKEHPEIIA